MQNLKVKTSKIVRFLKRKQRVNTDIKSAKPEFRLIVNKSIRYIHAQVLDVTGKVIASVCDKDQKATGKSAKAEAAGVAFAEVLKKNNVDHVAFDRNGHLYHGRVKSFADGLRKGGIAL